MLDDYLRMFQGLWNFVGACILCVGFLFGVSWLYVSSEQRDLRKKHERWQAEQDANASSSAP